MKKALTFFGAILFASAILTSCGGSSEKKAETPAPAKPKDAQTTTPATDASSSTTPSSDMPSSDVPSSDATSSGSSSSCDQFCSDYEEFMDSYIAILKKQKANPTDASIMAEYSQILSKQAAMQKDSQDCAGNPDFAARIAKIAAKMAAAASAM
jgi:hypothetical protein